MSGDSPDQAWSTAIEQLESLGLSVYAARTFVALLRIGRATAREISNSTDVPRTRVYDAVDELQEHGLVDVQRSTPKQFWAVSAETTGRYFDRKYTDRVNRLTDALGELSPPERSTEQRGVWTVTGRDTVTQRIVDFVSSAEEEVVFVTADELLTDELVASLSAASDRGVSIRFAEMSDSTEREFADRLPEAEYFDSIWDWADTPAGRLLLVDGETTLVSVLVDGDGDYPPEPRDETAIWGTGTTNGLVIVVEALFTWQLENDR